MIPTLPWEKVEVLVPLIEFVGNEYSGVIYRDQAPFYERKTLIDQLNWILYKYLCPPWYDMKVEIRWGQSERPAEVPIMTRFRIHEDRKEGNHSFVLVDMHKLSFNQM